MYFCFLIKLNQSNPLSAREVFFSLFIVITMEKLIAKKYNGTNYPAFEFALTFELAAAEVLKTEMTKLSTNMSELKIRAANGRNLRESTSRYNSVRCFNCNRPDHRQAQCRNHVNVCDCKCIKCLNKPFESYSLTNNDDSEARFILDSGASNHFWNNTNDIEN